MVLSPRLRERLGVPIRNRRMCEHIRVADKSREIVHHYSCSPTIVPTGALILYIEYIKLVPVEPRVEVSFGPAPRHRHGHPLLSTISGVESGVRRHVRNRRLDEPERQEPADRHQPTSLVSVGQLILPGNTAVDKANGKCPLTFRHYAKKCLLSYF